MLIAIFAMVSSIRAHHRYDCHDSGKFPAKWRSGQLAFFAPLPQNADVAVPYLAALRINVEALQSWLQYSGRRAAENGWIRL